MKRPQPKTFEEFANLLARQVHDTENHPPHFELCGYWPCADFHEVAMNEKPERYSRAGTWQSA